MTKTGDKEASRMRIVVVGAGAIGGTIAGKLLQAGIHEVSILARGKTLEAIRANGLRLISNNIETRHHVRISDNPEELGVHDLAILAVKGNAMPQLAASLRPLLSQDSIVICAQNGIPWWFDKGFDNAAGTFPLTSIDPGGQIRTVLSAHGVLGCVISFPSKVIAPGVIEHASDQCLISIGTPDRRLRRDEVVSVGASLSASGVTTEVSDDIRHTMWIKLVLNLFFGPISVLTGASIGKLQGETSLVPLLAQVIDECAKIARAWGTEIGPSAEKLLAWRASTPSHKSSMLQDYEAGRELEIDPIVSAPLQLARERGVPTPAILILDSLLRLKLFPVSAPRTV
jgi:2-dehydropantoate 2-reductase